MSELRRSTDGLPKAIIRTQRPLSAFVLYSRLAWLIEADRVRCNRTHPCSNCSSRGLSSSCTYSATRETLSSRPSGATYMQERINQLENLVLNVMQQTPSSPHQSPPRQSPAPSGANPQRPLAARFETQREVSPSPSDYGSIRIRESGVSYVSSVHWAAVLDSITELRHHFEQDDEPNTDSSYPVQLQAPFPGPQLLYGCPLHVTPASILESLPPRPVVDKLISRYFNDLDMATGMVSNFANAPKIFVILLVTDWRLGIVHRGKFLREVPPTLLDPNLFTFLFLVAFSLNWPCSLDRC